MKQNEVAIVKNGYDIARIIETNSDEETCDFKIVFMVESKYIDIQYLKVLSNIMTLDFDKTKKIEITYHKAIQGKSTKIHLKLFTDDGIKYIPILTRHLLDPNFNTEIPIPLFKLVIPKEINGKVYVKKAHHKVFDIGDNNIVEVFLTQPDYMKCNLFYKWQFLNRRQVMQSMEYSATGADKYSTYNINLILKNCRKYKKPINTTIGTKITEDIGIYMRTIYNEDLKEDKFKVLFIENKYALAFLIRDMIIFEEKVYPRAYMIDLENSQYFNNEMEKRKWQDYFENEIDKLDYFFIYGRKTK